MVLNSNYILGKKAVVFDLDGVLWLSAAAHARAYAEALAGEQIRGVAYRELAGRRTDEAIRHAMSSRGVLPEEPLVKQITVTKRRLARRYLAESLPVAPNCLSVLSDLRLRCRLALASSASRANVEMFLAASRTGSLFDVVLSGDDVSAAKPAPDIFLKALDRLNLAGNDALVVEDAISGIEAANRAGIDALAIAGTEDRRSLEAERVVGVIDRLEEIRPWPRGLLSLAAAEPVWSGTSDPRAWTAIIPAAGRGSRLGFDRPKILYPLLGRPLIDWLLDLVAPLCDRVVLVLSPSGVSEVEPLLRRRLASRLEIVVQERPTGMGDAVLLADDAVQTPNCCVVWGDQVLLSNRTVRTCLGVHQGCAKAVLTMPTVVKADPYIHFQRDADDRIVAVQQAREGEIQSRFGENDCGLFAFGREPLFKALREAKRQATATGRSTGEFNLLQVIPRLENGLGQITTVRIEDASETLGVNTPDEAARAAELLSSRRAGLQAA